jgi:glycerol-3-phosphate dehydrogenase
MRLFIRERRALARVAPHLVRPLPFIVPTYRHPLRSASAMRVALAVNDLVSRDRHLGLDDPALQLPNGRIVSRDECLQLNPFIDAKGVTGGAIWHDYQMYNTDRVTLSFVLSAAERGAATANYVTAAALLRDGRNVRGVQAQDTMTGQSFDIVAKSVINATGPWAASFLSRLKGPTSTPAPRLSRAMNLVLNQLNIQQGCGGRARGRFLFLAPWRHVTLLGTSHDVHEGDADALAVSRWDLETFLADAREAFPNANLNPQSVRLVHRGLLPMVSGHEHDVRLLRESAVVDHSADGVPGLVSMFGVRYTTARATAERAVDAVLRQMGDRSPSPSQTAETPIVGGGILNKDAFVRSVTARRVSDVSADMLQRLALTYGTTYEAVLHPLTTQPDLAFPLGQSCSVSGLEILHAVRHESAVRLSDALIRRTEAGSAGHPGEDAINRAATIAAKELGWDEWRTRNEVAEVEAFYRKPE